MGLVENRIAEERSMRDEEEYSCGRNGESWGFERNGCCGREQELQARQGLKGERNPEETWNCANNKALREKQGIAGEVMYGGRHRDFRTDRRAVGRTG